MFTLPVMDTATTGAYDDVRPAPRALATAAVHAGRDDLARQGLPAPPLAPAVPAQQIHIRPLVAAGPPEEQPPPTEAASPPGGDAVAPGGSLRLGELQVRPSGRD